MKKLVPLFFLFMLTGFSVLAQLGVNSDNTPPDPSAGLDVKFTNKGLLPPRVALTAINSAVPVAAPAVGLLVYNTATSGTPPNNVLPGYHCWNGSNWIPVAPPQGTNIGDMLYWNGTKWVILAAGSNGQLLSLANNMPAWGNSQLPALNTTDVISIASTHAGGGGNVVLHGGYAVTARGVCWSTSPNPGINDSHTTDGSGLGVFSSTLTGLLPNTLYYVRAYATSAAGTGYGNELSFTTILPCGTTITVNHLAGLVAPVSKIVNYNTVNNIPGEPLKCWITNNLGSDHQASAKNDNSEESSGWYWQFNSLQGYKHTGSSRIPNTSWITSINESSDWTEGKDPCKTEMGGIWRIPTSSEYSNIDAAGGWVDWNGPWNSDLKLHAAGALNTGGSLMWRGSAGYYWCGSQSNSTDGYFIYISGGSSYVSGASKAYGFSLRCISEN